MSVTAAHGKSLARPRTQSSPTHRRVRPPAHATHKPTEPTEHLPHACSQTQTTTADASHTKPDGSNLGHVEVAVAKDLPRIGATLLHGRRRSRGCRRHCCAHATATPPSHPRPKGSRVEVDARPAGGARLRHPIVRVLHLPDRARPVRRHRRQWPRSERAVRRLPAARNTRPSPPSCPLDQRCRHPSPTRQRHRRWWNAKKRRPPGRERPSVPRWSATSECARRLHTHTMQGGDRLE